MVRRASRTALTGLLAIVLGGCSTSGLAVKSFAPVLRNTVDATLRSDDPDLVGDGLPTSLLLIEGMSETSPGNREIAELGGLLYFAYAFAFVEDTAPERASGLYSRGLGHAWRSFHRPALEHAIREGTFDEVSAAIERVSRDDAEALLWVCANWGMWIQLNLEKPRAAADLARLLPLAERVASLDETLYWGMPRILLGALHAGRPVTLGGNPDRSRAEFERAFAVSDRNMLLAQVFFAKFWCVQTFDAEAFASALREVLDAPPGKLPDAELLNRIAQRKAQALLPRAEEIFE